MIFRRRVPLYKKERYRLYSLMEQLKESLNNQNMLIERSIDPSEEVLKRRAVTESLYSFLLKEIRYEDEKKFKL